MGHCSSIALGVALAQPTRQVICVDGDGAALMHMGAMATIGNCGNRNFKHILINNGVHDSVGGQLTNAGTMDLRVIAQACGYRYTRCVSAVSEIKEALEQVNNQD